MHKLWQGIECHLGDYEIKYLDKNVAIHTTVHLQKYHGLQSSLGINAHKFIWKNFVCLIFFPNWLIGKSKTDYSWFFTYSSVIWKYSGAHLNVHNYFASKLLWSIVIVNDPLSTTVFFTVKFSSKGNIVHCLHIKTNQTFVSKSHWPRTLSSIQWLKVVPAF